MSENEIELDPIGDENEVDEIEIAADVPTDEEGFLDVDAIPDTPAPEVVVQDFDPENPEAELAEPQQVSTREHRTARQVRKDAQRGNLDKS